jgi:glucose-1-phosphate thymidylyltransferase
MKGLILAAGKGTRLAPITQYVNKHLLPIFNKPMIYYPLSTLILAGCDDIAIIINESDFQNYQNLLQHLNKLKINCEFIFQDPSIPGIPSAIAHAADFVGDDNLMVILGDNVFFGSNFINALKSALTNDALVVTQHVSNPNEYGVVSRSKQGYVIDFIEKPRQHISDEVVTGLYFFPSDVFKLCNDLKPSARNETEITELLKFYLKRNSLSTFALPRGVTWLDTGSFGTLFNSAAFVQSIEDRNAECFGYIEEAALSRNLIDIEELNELVMQMGQNQYRDYLQRVIANAV